MMSFRLAANELRKLTTGTLPKLAMAALVCVPLLYASLYLYANYDPYGRLDKLPAAVVTTDAGATTQDGQHRDVGREVTDEVVKSKTFDWHNVSPAEANDGVTNDRFYFAISIPKDFSAALLSSGNFNPQQATITLTTNDANNYLSGTIANQVAEQVRKTIAEKVGTEAAQRFLIGFSTIYGKTAEATNGANQLASGAQQLLDGQQQLSGGAQQLATGGTQLASGLNTLKDNTTQLPAKSRELADGAGQVAAGNTQVAQFAGELAGASADLQRGMNDTRGAIADRLRGQGFDESQIQQVLGALDQLRAPIDAANGRVQGANTQLSTLADGSRRVADGASQLAGSAPALAGGIQQASGGANQLADGAGKLAAGEQDAVRGGTQLRDGANQLRDGLNAGLNQIPNPDDPTRNATANTIANPVAVANAGVAKAGTYGQGLAPFFISLATWIGAFVLFLLLRPLSTRALTAGASPFRVALGGWLASAVLGIAQVIVLFGAVTWLVGIKVAQPVSAIGFAVLVSLSFTAIVHALNALFGAVGKFLGLVLLVLQLVSAGGTFPWQTIPDALYPVHVALPMSYAIDGFRHLLYTGANVQIFGDIAVLAAYLVAGVMVSTLAAQKRRMWTVAKLKPELNL